MGARNNRAVSLGGGARVGGLSPDALDATRERLRHALGEGEVTVEAGARRLCDPFETLRRRQALDRESRARNDLLGRAGERFRQHWHGGHLDGLTAFDFVRDSVDGGAGPHGTPPSEAALRHRTLYRGAMRAVGDRLLPFLTGIVIEGRPAKALVPLVSEAGHARTAEAIVIERLREALHRLVAHWQLDGSPGRRDRDAPEAAVSRPGPCRG